MPKNTEVVSCCVAVRAKIPVTMTKEVRTTGRGASEEEARAKALEDLKIRHEITDDSTIEDIEFELLFTETETDVKRREMYDYFETRISKAIYDAGSQDDDVRVQYSAYETDEDAIQIDNLDQVVIAGKCVFIEDEFGPGLNYQSPVLNDPTWLDLCVHFNNKLLKHDTYGHTYLEGVTRVKDKTIVIDGEEIPVWGFVSGS